MELCYIISAYKYPHQLVRLVDRLQGEQTHFFIHYDKRSSDSEFRQIRHRLSGAANVHWLERHKCFWGDFGHVRATIKGIQAIIRHRLPCDYTILLTAQDYPIKTNTDIRGCFAASAGRSFMRYRPLPVEEIYEERGGLDRIERWHFRLFNQRHGFPLARRFSNPALRLLSAGLHAVLPGRRRFPAGFTPFWGSSYWCLSRECVEYIHEFIARHRRFVDFFHHVAIPDELFFQTILINSPLRQRIVNDDLRYIVWPFAGSPNPAILGTQDFSALAQSGALFARKFDATEDAEILDMIDKDILKMPAYAHA